MRRLPQVSRRKTLGYWGRILGANVAASVLVLAVFGGISRRTPPREIAVAFAIAFVFSSCIGPLLGVAMPRVSPWILRRVRSPFNWFAIVVVMIVLAVAGSSVAITLLTIVGYLPPGRFTEWLAGSLKAAIVVTLTIGLLFTVYEMMQAQLKAAALTLRTKERDEADARRIAAEAQLAALEARVQPHFLFNTLNSIAALIHDDPASAERMTAQLAALMRSSLDGNRPLIALDDELRTVRNYLEIERVRFGDRLRYDIDVDDSLGSAQVPRLSVQTLVENSVKYAVSPRRGGGTVAVRAASGNGVLRVTVEDDGPGFDPTELTDGHGLALVRARLAMLFGDAASLDIQSPGEGTIVTLSVPASGAQTVQTLASGPRP
jgi:two-component system sensor histidine kinase AlgZ